MEYTIQTLLRVQRDAQKHFERIFGTCYFPNNLLSVGNHHIFYMTACVSATTSVQH